MSKSNLMLQAFSILTILAMIVSVIITIASFGTITLAEVVSDGVVIGLCLVTSSICLVRRMTGAGESQGFNFSVWIWLFNAVIWTFFLMLDMSMLGTM